MPGKRPGGHPNARAGRGRRRTAAWLAALTVPGALLIAAAIWLVSGPAGEGAGSAHVAVRAGRAAPVRSVAPVSWPAGGSTAATVSRGPVSLALAGRSSGPGGGGLTVSIQVRRSCPPSASACADLRDHLTWLQSRGRVTYGPVQMEPGRRADPTPRGTFHVAWKAGAHYISTSFGIPIPYAVFFAPGGIAFHAGSLSSSSHGCIHLRLADARHYHDHLPDGAEVVVF